VAERTGEQGRNPGGTLEPLAKAGADLQIVMGYRYPGDNTKAVVELYPVGNKKTTQAAQGAGLTASTIPALFVEGDNRPGLGHGIAQAIAEAGVNLEFPFGASDRAKVFGGDRLRERPPMRLRQVP